MVDYGIIMTQAMVNKELEICIQREKDKRNGKQGEPRAIVKMAHVL